MPDRELSRQEREEMMATMIVAESRKDVDPKVWTPAHVALIKAAAEDPLVTRIFVNGAIKKGLCRDAGSSDRAWLHKVQPWHGHDWHFHVRLQCPPGEKECEGQALRPADEGCRAKDFDGWFDSAAGPPKPDAKPAPGRPGAKISARLRASSDNVMAKCGDPSRRATRISPALNPGYRAAQPLSCLVHSL
jgi:penicillin-insensitive murein endopeptidase